MHVRTNTMKNVAQPNGLITSSRPISALRPSLLAGSAIVVLAALLSNPAAAQSSASATAAQSGAGQQPTDAVTGASQQPTDALEEIVVTGHYRFLDKDTSGTTNLPLPIEKVPQSISLVSNDFIKAADLQNLGEIAQYTPGAVNSGAPGNFVSNLDLRGFPAGYAINGLTIIHLDYEPDTAVVDRLEVVQGPSSVIYGASSPGGLINLVLKSPTPNTSSYLQTSGGSWGNWRLEGQVAGPLTASGNIRGIGVAAYEQGDSFVDFVNHQRYVIYGGLDFDLSESLTAYVRASYEDYKRISFDGVPTYEDGSVVSLPRSFFLGGKNQYETTDTYRVNAGLSWEASPIWKIDLKAFFQEEDTSGAETYAITNIEQNGDFLYSLEHDLSYPIQDISVDLSSVYKLDDLGLDGSFLSASAIYQEQKKDETSTFSNAYPANVFAGDVALTNLIATKPFDNALYISENDLSYLTLSGQAVFKIGESLSLLGGISDSINPSIKNTSGYAPLGPEQSYDPGSQISYRAALTEELISGLNIYGSYSESFQPQTLLNPNNQLLPPSTGKQYEVGVKYMTPNHNLLLTGALFQIDQTNVGEAANLVSAITYYEPTGQQRNRGFELQAIGKVTKNWQINAGFTFLDPRVTKDEDNTIIGKTVPFLPRSTASLFTSYNFDSGLLNGFFVSMGYRYVDSVKTSFGSTQPLPSYELVDAAVGYVLDTWRFQLSAKNIFNERYTLSAYQSIYYGNVTGEPTRLTFSVRKDL